MASYTVKKGDTLYSIAKNNGTTVDAIAKASGIKDVNKIYSGQKITLPTSGSKKGTSNGSNKGTNNVSNQTKTPTVMGADSSLVEKGMTPFTTSTETQALEENRKSIGTAAQEYFSKPFELPEGVMDTLNTPFAPSQSYLDAMSMLTQQGKKMQNGTKWDSLYESSINDYLNRDEFEYDVDNDQLFQQALASAMNSGKTAMQDTIGQASALTGGYGSTYATSVGNQTYNAFIEDAYDNLPQYYQMAMEAYQMEGQEMLNQINTIGAAAQNEWNRGMDIYNMYADTADRIWNQDTFTWEAGQNQAMNLANVSMDMHQIQGDDLMNAYTIADKEYQTSYGTDYDSWKSMIDVTWNAIDYANKDYWSQQSYDQSERQFGANQSLKEKEYKISTGDTNMDGELSAEEQAAMNTSYSYDAEGNVVASSSNKSGKLSNGAGVSSMVTYKQKAAAAYSEGGDDAVDKYVDSLGLNDDEKAEIGAYVYGDGENKGYGVLPLGKRTFTKIDDTFNWFGGTDNNDMVQDQYGNAWKLSELKSALKKEGIDDKEIKKIISELTKTKKNDTYTYSSK